MEQRISRTAGRARRVTAWPGAIIGLIIATALASVAGAQEASATLQIASIEAEQWPEAQAVLTVLDADGRPAPDLAAADFQVFLNDEPATVSGVSRGVDSTLPIAVVLALDISGSMEGGALDRAKAAAESFLDGLAPQDTVAVVTFGNTVETVLPFTSDRDAASTAIGQLVAEGATALYEATAESIEQAAAVENSRRAVVLLSDGLDNGSLLPRDDALAVAGALRVPVFAIGLGEDIDRTYLQALADAAGGGFAETPTPDGLADLYLEVGELLRGQYVVSINAASLALPASQAAALRVEAAIGSAAASDERVICPQHLCVALTAIADGDRLAEARTVVAEVVADEAVASVAFLVDGAVALEVTEPPYEFTFSPDAFDEGEHTFAVEATTGTTTVRTDEVTVHLGAAGGGLSIGTLALPAVAVIAVAALVIGYIWWRRRRGDEGDTEQLAEALRIGPSGDARARLSWDEREPLPQPKLEKVLGRLRVTSGPLAGQEFPVGGAPSSIGCGEECLIRLPVQTASEDEVVREHARVWVRDDHLMVHAIRRLTERGATGGQWLILAPGDDFTIWNHTFEFVPLDADGNGAQPASNGSPKNEPAGAPQPQAGPPPAADEAPPNVLRDKPEKKTEPAPLPDAPASPVLEGPFAEKPDEQGTASEPDEPINILREPPANEQPAEPATAEELEDLLREKAETSHPASSEDAAPQSHPPAP